MTKQLTTTSGLMRFSPKNIKDELDMIAVGQEDAKRTLSILAFNHFCRYYRNVNMPHVLTPPPRLTGFITGPTGSGKTLMIKALAQYLNLPFLIIDAVGLTMPGFSGTSIHDHFMDYINTYRKSYLWDVIEYGIIYIDEFDKLGGSTIETTKSGDWHRDIQTSLLTIIDGTLLPLSEGHHIVHRLNTEKMLFIFSGAFEYTMKNRKVAKTIGYHSNHEEENKKLTAPLTREEIEQSGIIRELIGRISVITSTSRLSKDEIRKVIFDCRDAIFLQYQALFIIGGVYNFELTEVEIIDIIDKVHKADYGMRYLKSIIFEILKEKIFELHINDVAYQEVTYDVYGNTTVDEIL